MVDINQLPKIVPDRDKQRNWYLDEATTHRLHNGDIIIPHKGYRFDGHSIMMAAKIFTVLATVLMLLGLYLIAITPWLFVLLSYYLIKTSHNKRDIYAALIHDYLIDMEHSHRYPRDFMDKEYEILMDRYAKGIRRYLMPKAVWLYGYLGWTLLGDYRGDYNKYKTRISVKVEVI